jgi:hypothetical protein
MWYERNDVTTKAEPEDDVVVFPEEARFEKVGKHRACSPR